MRYRVAVKGSECVEFDSGAFHIIGPRRIACYLVQNNADLRNHEYVELFLGGEIQWIKDDHGRVLYSA